MTYKIFTNQSSKQQHVEARFIVEKRRVKYTYQTYICAKNNIGLVS